MLDGEAISQKPETGWDKVGFHGPELLGRLAITRAACLVPSWDIAGVGFG